MPIRRQNRWLYPIDWPELSAAIRFRRAAGRCERCGRPHGALVICGQDGRWWDPGAMAWRSALGRIMSGGPEPHDDGGWRSTRVFLATAHLDHDPTNNRARNLKALCQRCHLANDREEHRRVRRLTFLKRRAIGDLFLGPYSD